MELHDLLVKTYYQRRPATLANRPQERQLSDAIAICFGSSMTPGIVPDGERCPPSRPASRAAATAYRRGGCSISYVPRNNFYAHAYPQPLAQGCRYGPWPEYWCWEDAATPKRWLYRHFTSRRNDLDWSINQVCFAATVSDRPGVLAIRDGDRHAVLRELSW